MKIPSLAALIFLSAFSLNATQAQPPPPHAKDPSAPTVASDAKLAAKDAATLIASRDSFIDDLLNKMSLVEQLGQLAMETRPLDLDLNAGNAQTGPVDTEPQDNSKPLPGHDYASIVEDIKTGRVGSFLNIVGERPIRELQKIALTQSPNRIPLLFSFDVLRGQRTIFPSPLAESSSWDVALAERTARVAAVEADAQGLHLTFAPDADVARDARWGRVMETFGEDPYLVGEFVKAKVRGFQGVKLGVNGTIAATLKHFVGYSAVQSGREYNTVSISPTDLYNFHLPPFVEGVASGARAVMPSFTDVDSIPLSVNKDLVDDLLRGRIGFKGVVVSDFEGIRETINHGVSLDETDAARKALRASVDIDMVGRSYRSLEKAKLSDDEKSRIRRAARRVLELKWELGLFNDAYRNLDPVREKDALLTPDSRRIARDAVAKSTILLKNEKVLPLKKRVRTAAVVGMLADAKQELIGTWSGAGRASEVVSIREALAQPGFFRKTLYADGSQLLHEARTIAALALHQVQQPKSKKSQAQMLTDAARAARSADITIAVVGELALMSGENASRSDIAIPEPQMALLRVLRKSSKKLVTIVIAGRPLILTEALALSDAVLYAGQPGTEAGNGIRDLLFGDVNPSAKTTMSFPRAVGQLPLIYNQKPTGRPSVPGMPYKSNYMDIENDPLIPFGFGLSYSKFEHGETTLSKNEMSGDGKDFVLVRAPVKNVSDRAGVEIVQLYLRDEVASIERPILELKGFKRLELEPGEEKVAEFKIGIDDLSFFNAKLERVAEPGAFIVMTGPDSVRLTRKSLMLR